MQPSRFIVKICGITNVSDAQAVLDAGANWIGLNFVGGPRRVELPTALEIINSLSDPSAAVGLISLDDAGHPSVIEALVAAGVRRLQLYGDVSPSDLESFAARGLESIFVRPIGNETQLAGAASFLQKCSRSPDFVLADAHVPGQQGGTGQKADWEILQRAKQGGGLADWPPILLAGGLTADNVAEAVRSLAPAGVDVASGVESRPGVKDPDKMRAFVSAAHSSSRSRARDNQA